MKIYEFGRGHIRLLRYCQFDQASYTRLNFEKYIEAYVKHLREQTIKYEAWCDRFNRKRTYHHFNLLSTRTLDVAEHMLKNDCSFKETGKLLGISGTVVSKHFYVFCRRMRDTLQEVVKKN